MTGLIKANLSTWLTAINKTFEYYDKKIENLEKRIELLERETKELKETEKNDK